MMSIFSPFKNQLRYFRDVITFTQLSRKKKQIIFYSENKSYWIHLSEMIFNLLEKFDISICFISSSEDDPGLKIKHPNFSSFLIGDGALRNWFFENAEADIFVMTMPDLNQYQVKISKHSIHYVYIHHSMVSLHMAYREGAYDFFDTMFCAGPHHKEEMKAIEKHRNLKPKNIIEHGYGRLDSIIKLHKENKISAKNTITKVIIAPSWGDCSIIPNVGFDLVKILLESGFKVTLRPHPQTVKYFKPCLNKIKKRFVQNENFILENDVSEQRSLLEADIMISDWSGAAIDFSFGLLKPILFIDVPPKINNPSYKEIQIEPFESKIRTEIGNILAPDKIYQAPEFIKMLINKPKQIDHLKKIRNNLVYNVNNSSSVGCNTLIKILKSLEND